MAAGGVQCRVRSGLPTRRRCVRRNPAAQRAASLAQLTLRATAQVAEILKDYADDEMGDRRQELVFIGVNMDREAITRLLDGCLLTETELVAYNQHWIKGPAAAKSAA